MKSSQLDDQWRYLQFDDGREEPRTALISGRRGFVRLHVLASAREVPVVGHLARGLGLETQGLRLLPCARVGRLVVHEAAREDDVENHHRENGEDHPDGALNPDHSR